MACMDFSGLDLDSSSNLELNQVRQQLSYALEQLQEQGAVLTWHVRRRRTTRYPQAQFPEPVSAHMDALLHEQFLKHTQYVNRHSLSLCIYPQAQSARMLSALARSQERGGGLWEALKALGSGLRATFKGEDEFPYQDMSEVEPALEHFDKTLEAFLAATAQLNTHVLRGEQLGGFLQLCACPISAMDQVADLPAPQYFMDTAMPVGDIDNGHSDVLRFEHNARQAWASCYSIDLRKCDALGLDALDKLMAAPFEFTLAHVFKMLPRNKAQRVVGEVHAYHSNRRYPIKSILMAAMQRGDLSGVPVNEARQESTDEAQELKDRLSVGQAGVGYYYGVVMVQGASLAACDEARKACEEILQTARLTPRLEGLHKFSSWCATVPGSHAEVARWLKIDTQNFVDLCPARTVATGSFYNEYLSSQLGQPCTALLALPTRHRTPFYYTGYVGDVGHELVVGPTGTGKTTISTLLWTAFRKYPGARVVVFDKNYSCRPAILLQGGNYIDLNPEKQQAGAAQRHRMSPIAALMSDGRTQHIGFVARWIEMLAALRGYTPTSEDRKALETALRSTAELGRVHPQSLRLGTVVVKLDLSKDFARALEMWTGTSAYGAYFDNEVDNFDLDALVGVEMGSILTDDELAAPFMAYAFYRLAAQLRDMGAHEQHPIPTLIYIPETWYFLRQEVFRKELEEWLVTLRKLGARICFDTQNPDKLVQSPIFAAFRDNIQSFICTPNPKAKTASLERMYREELGFSEEDIAFICNGMPKKDYFIKQGEVSRRISLALPAPLLPLIRTDQKAQIALQRFIDRGLPEGWQQHYLEELEHG